MGLHTPVVFHSDSLHEITRHSADFTKALARAIETVGSAGESKPVWGAATVYPHQHSGNRFYYVMTGARLERLPPDEAAFIEKQLVMYRNRRAREERSAERANADKKSKKK